MLRKVFVLVVVLFSIGATQAYGDSSVHKWGIKLDSWREQGASSITDSPVYAKGVRLSAWSYGEGDDYQFAIAHVEYLFSAPSWAHSMDITVAYSGDDGEWGSGPAGRLWIKRVASDEGDSFELPEGKKSQSIRLSTRDYNDNGWMTLRVIAEGSQEIDVDYINLRFYTSAYYTRIVERPYPDYVWEPWYRYTYWHFYPGRCLYWDPYLGYWVIYTYPRYTYNWAVIRYRYNVYLRGYYCDEHRWHTRTGGRGHIGRWTPDYRLARRDYAASGLSGRRFHKPAERVRSVLTQHKRRSIDVTQQGRGDIKTGVDARQRSSGTKNRREVAREWLADRTPVRDGEGAKLAEINTRRGSWVRTGTRTDFNSSVRQAPSEHIKTRSGLDSSARDSAVGPTRDAQRVPSDVRSGGTRNGIVKARREYTQTRTPERPNVRQTYQSQSHVKQAPQRYVRQAPVQTEDEEKRRGSGGSAGARSSTEKKKVRTR